jgi:hypothetical protein
MKCLIIENGKGYFSLDGISKTALDQLTKNDMLNLLNKIVSEDVEMDEYNEGRLLQAAHRIIYRNLYQRFNDLVANKTRFIDESESLYRPAIEKYKVMISDVNTPQKS